MSDWPEILLEGAAGLGLHITGVQMEKFRAYYRLLQEANRRVKLTALTTPGDVAVKHFIDSLTCFQSGVLEGSITLADIGSGAGMPGIPLKICQPSIDLTLVDSLDKRVRFLNEAIEKLGLKQARALHARAEDLGRDQAHREKYDCLVARAVADLRVLAEYCLPLVRTGGFFIAMKGPGLSAELAGAQFALHVLGGAAEKTVSLELPYSGEARNILLVKKISPTPGMYPRRAGLPGKKPLQET